MSSASGIVITAPTSGAGKTVVTLALLRAFRLRDVAVAGAKCGPDYIDPGFHAAACGVGCVNLDAWAMSQEMLIDRARSTAANSEFLIVEGAMGTIDGAGVEGRGCTGSIAAALGLPVVVVLDAQKTSQSCVLPVLGLRVARPNLDVAGVILNRVGSDRHDMMLRSACERHGIDVLGSIPKLDALRLPERHLGLVQADEHAELQAFLDRAAFEIEVSCDLDEMLAMAWPMADASLVDLRDERIAPLGQNIAVAQDCAFRFAYPHMLEDWRRAGANLSFFSPLADEAPASDCDAIFLPGGYPELHAGKIANAAKFKHGVRTAAENGKLIYGECGGYMTLGRGLVDADGSAHEMLDLLPVETTFASRQRHLGYRRLRPIGPGPWTTLLAAHEFHYSSVLTEAEGDRLFDAYDSDGARLAPIGLRRGSVMGSYAHVIGPVLEV